MRLRILVLAAFAGAVPLPAQEMSIRLRVVDTTGLMIPHALVQPANRVARVASDSGRIELRVPRSDSLKVIVRRIGFAPFEGWIRERLDGTEEVIALTPLARQLRGVTVTAGEMSLLARRGFYDRMERVERGAIVARFITPEELDLRQPTKISQMLNGETLVKVTYRLRRTFIEGRGKCPVTVLLDGQRMLGMVEEVLTRSGEAEALRRARASGKSYQQVIDEMISERLSVDDLLPAASVTAVEIYASAASVPVELQRNMSSESCGLVAFWTGARR